MFDFSFGELAIIGVVALVVLGPEKLPKVARTAGHLMGRARAYASQVKSDIDREVQMDELRKLQQQAQEAARSFESAVHDASKGVEQETAKIESSVVHGDALTELAPSATTVSPSGNDEITALETSIAEQANAHTMNFEGGEVSAPAAAPVSAKQHADDDVR